LFGRGAVHGLDDERHRVRKAMFMDVVTPPAVHRLAESVAEGLDRAAAGWAGRPRVELFDEAVRVFGEAVLRWAGVPAPPPVVDGWSRDLALIVDGFGGVGPRHLRAVLARRRSERWARSAVRATRSGLLHPPAGSALDLVSRHTDADGRPLREHTAAVELLNVVRPTVAVAWFAGFLGLALHRHPQWRPRLASGDDEVVEAFVHEIRRYYPFVPALAARVRHEFRWQGHRFRRGQRVLLDVHGIDHDGALWPDPGEFRPERFLGRPIDPFGFVPQGGGDPRTGHRCPGERIVIELLKVLAVRLARLDYDVAEQELGFSTERMPTRPVDGFVLTHVTLPVPGPAAAR
jgi:fatty-acid peroxygenase